MEQDENGQELVDRFSAMAWEVASAGKNRREVGILHETWALTLSSECGAFDKAQEHLDQALQTWIEYDEPVLVARAWCLKGSCSGEAGDFTAAAASFKHAHQLAEDTDDGPLLLVVLANRAICEIWRGDVKAAATRSRRAFISAEAEGGSEMILVAHCIRASSYQTAGNFLAACNEYETATKLIANGDVLPPAPIFSIAMDTNFGVSILRSGKPERAIVPFERALETARKVPGGTSPLTLARCLFHAGEARRQARQHVAASALLEEASAIVAFESTAGASKTERSKWGALEMEVANSRGLCVLAEGARRFNGGPTAARGDNSPETSDCSEAPTISSGADIPGSDLGQPNLPRVATGANSSKMEDGDSIEGGGSTSKQRKPKQETNVAEKAAMLIAAGGRAGEMGAHPVQKTSSAILEGIAWSLAGKCNSNGAAALKRADKAVEKLLDRDRPSLGANAKKKSAGKQQRVEQPSTVEPLTPLALKSEAIGQNGPAGSESDGQLRALQLSVICSQGLVARGGLGLGGGCCTGVAARMTTPASAGAAGALSANAAARAATKIANAGWVEAGQLVKKQLAYAEQATVESSWQLSVASAHAGAIDLMSGKPAETAENFERQLKEARKAGDVLLEALAERNLSDICEVDGNLPRALRHLRRCRGLAQRGQSTALEVDTCRRLSAVYAEIAAAALPGLGTREQGGVTEPVADKKGSDLEGGGGESDKGGEESVGGEEGSDEGAKESIGDMDGESREEGTEENCESISPESKIELKEDSDKDFLQATAADRARLFAERYEAAVLGLQWPVSNSFSRPES